MSRETFASKGFLVFKYDNPLSIHPPTSYNKGHSEVLKMFIILDIFPLISIGLICLSLWFIASRKELLSKPTLFILFSLNIVFIFVLSIIFIFYKIDNLTVFPPWIYWLLIISAIIIGIFSTLRKHIAGQLLAAALLLFTTFVTLFSIGIFLFILFFIQLFFIIIQWKKQP